MSWLAGLAELASSGFKWETLIYCIRQRETKEDPSHHPRPRDTRPHPHAQPCTYMHSHQNQSQQAKDAKMVVALKGISICLNGSCLDWTKALVELHKLSMVAHTCNPVLRKWEQKGQNFQVTFSYTASSRSAWTSDGDQITRITCEVRCERCMGAETGTRSALSLWLLAPSSPIESIQKTQEIEHPKTNK